MSEHSTTPRRRRRISRNHQRTKPPNPCLSSSRSRRACAIRGLKPPRSIKLDLQRCHSEPILWTIGVFFDDHDSDEKNGSRFDRLLFSPQSCLDIFAPPPMSPLATNSERYNKDAKVVVNVTVEGSPGPVRTLVKLGASVEDTIKLVVNKYSEEGRSPHLAPNGISSFELHQSHFSLQSIDKKDTIGDVGTRSFYLRKSCSGRNEDGTDVRDVVTVKSTAASSHFVLMPSFIARKMTKVGRRMRKLWQFLGCSL